MLTPKENLLRAIRRQSPEWVPLDLESAVWLYPPYAERAYTAGPDAFGVLWALEPEAEGGTFPAHDGHPVRDLARWREQTRFPDPGSMDWSQITVGWGTGGQPFDPAAIDRENHLVVGIVELGLFERTYLLLGMENALMAYASQPEQMEELVAAIADFKIEVIRRFHATAKLDMVWFGDDWGMQERMFLRPALWRRVIKPHLARVYACMKELGILINQHSCGKIEPIIGDLVELGVDLWNPCQPCNDLVGLKQRYGERMAFQGGIDSQFVLARPGVTAGEVRAEVRNKIDAMAAGGGYIAAPSHSVPYDPALIHAMVEEIRVYGRQFYAHNPASGGPFPQ